MKKWILCSFMEIFTSYKSMEYQDKDRDFIIKEMKDYGAWMVDSAGHDCGCSINDLMEDSGDIYEVVVDIHLTNGDCVTVRNRCEESYLRQMYCGDTIEYCEIVEPKGFTVNYWRDEEYHQLNIPVSSICWIDGHTEEVNWHSVRSKIIAVKASSYGLKLEKGKVAE